MANKRNSKLPPTPATVDEVRFTDTWRNTSDNKRFLLFQDRGILIFATDEGLNFLSKTKSLLADGTFKSAPPPFTQIYTFFATAENWKIPVVWAILDF